MPLVTSETMLLAARQGGYAVGAFNAENMEMAQAIVQAACRARAPVILQTTPSTVRYGGLALYLASARALAESAPVPVAMHLDHGSSFELCAQAVRAGYTSVMIDGSKLPLPENIALTRHVAELGRACGVPVEGELGRVGGKEDDLACGAGAYTDPGEAVEFVRETGVSSLAVGVGTAHGVYAAAPVLNTGLVGRLKDLLGVPLVLHGASGLGEGTVRECIRQGICKVNFATELRAAYTAGVRRALAQDAKTFDPKTYGGAGRETVEQLVLDLIRVCGCGGRA